MSQPIVINIGALPNDGTGDPLRTAFNDTNLNFSNVFTAGPVGSNIQIANNSIITTDTNGNLVLAPNGTGIIQSNVTIVPNTANVRNLGSAAQRWSTIYAQYLDVSANLNIAGNIVYNGDLNVAGNLTVQGNIIQVGNIVTETLTIQLANAASTANAADGAGITVGATDDIATLLYNSTSNVWTTNIGLSSVGNVTAPYFIGDGSQLTGLGATYSNANVVTLLASFGSNTVSTTGNISGGYLFGNGSQLTGITAASTYGNANVVANLAALGSNPVSTTGNVTGAYILGNGSALTSLPAPAVTQDITSNGAMSIMTYDGNIKYVNYATVEPSSGNIAGGNISATGNVTGDYFIGDGISCDYYIGAGNLVVNVGTDGYGTWTFETGTGNLVGPGNATQGAGIVFSADQSVYVREDMGQLNIDAGSDIVITTNSGNVGNTQSWDFGSGGDLTVPIANSTQQSIRGTQQTILGESFPAYIYNSTANVIVWTADSDIVSGAQMTVRVVYYSYDTSDWQNTEMLDIMMAKTYPAGTSAFTVSNRLKTNAAYTNVPIDITLNGANALQVITSAPDGVGNNVYWTYSVTSFNQTFD